MTHRAYTSEHASLVVTSGLFDADYYRTENPDISEAGIDPFEHFLALGGFEGRNPNAYFSLTKYLEGHPEITLSGFNPLVYFLLYESTNTRAFHDFDPIWYRQTYPECCRNEMHPLGHYLTRGREKGYIRNPSEMLGQVQARELKNILAAPASLETVLFVTHAPNGCIKPHALHYIEAFRSAGICVTAIVVADDLRSVEYRKIAPHCDGLLLRQNGGYDFAAWAHALDYVDLRKTQLLFFANDSVVGPIDEAAFLHLINRVRGSKAELVGTTDNWEFTYHFQSFLFAVKGVGISQMLKFLSDVVILSDKQKVITTYETRFFGKLKESGVNSEVLFPCRNFSVALSTTYWRELVSQGFPFIKVEILRTVSRSIWGKTLRKYRYPIECADLTLELTKNINKINSKSAPQLKGAFRKPSIVKYRFYRTMEILMRPFSAEKSIEYARRAFRRKKG